MAPRTPMIVLDPSSALLALMVSSEGSSPLVIESRPKVDSQLSPDILSIMIAEVT